jgi:hypothetical protein
MPSALPTTDASTMWAFTTTGNLPDDHETRGYETLLAAWSDYHGASSNSKSTASSLKKPSSTDGTGSAP